ncbi:hypothetical protein CPB84DRAFT_254380 [Gymnopilus junonius]|uniref:Uncharacterized protein n=1 Tax=Gymnopilus junonius TaxID=109634 RepID=A0A9P5THD3_GYMJU|nr:hypothetical protein CPB84DRAFT_254380 [Gymnopilus junonius]
MQEEVVHQIHLNLHEDLENQKDFSQFWREKVGGNCFTELSSVELDVKELSYEQPRCLAARATTDITATGYGEYGFGETEMPMVCKVYHPEVQRHHEGLTMEVIYEIVQEDRDKVHQDEERAKLCISSMFNYLPKIYFYGDVKGTSTQRVRSMVHDNWKGHRTMRVIGMKKLKKITTVNGLAVCQSLTRGRYMSVNI